MKALGKPSIGKTLHPIHFEDLSGGQFERLAFAYISRIKEWNDLKWIGQVGGDGGQDIWGEVNGEAFCYQCANHTTLAFKKISSDIDKLVKGKTIPRHYIAITGSTVSVKLRAKVSSHALSAGISSAEVWSGAEFEEKLRKESPELLKRFFEGTSFPEPQSDADIIKQIIEAIDRPAFTTPFRSESSIPNFEKGITDAIEVLNTGMHRLRDGTLIKKIVTRHDLASEEIKGSLAGITKKVQSLRNKFIELRNIKEIRPCECNLPNCPTWFFSDNAAFSMDKIRKDIIADFRKLDLKTTFEFDE